MCGDLEHYGIADDGIRRMSRLPCSPASMLSTLNRRGTLTLVMTPVSLSIST